MVLPVWSPPVKIIPSSTHHGEVTKNRLHTAVGAALNEWEIVESILANIFGHLVESQSAAASRAYGTIMAGSARKEALEAATIEFFRGKPDPMMADFYSLFNAYSSAAQYRNNIAHGICYCRISTGGGDDNSGWFLYPPQYNTRRRSGVDNLNSNYIYKARDINHCRDRFVQLGLEASELENYLRVAYPLL